MPPRRQHVWRARAQADSEVWVDLLRTDQMTTSKGQGPTFEKHTYNFKWEDESNPETHLTRRHQRVEIVDPEDSSVPPVEVFAIKSLKTRKGDQDIRYSFLLEGDIVAREYAVRRVYKKDVPGIEDLTFPVSADDYITLLSDSTEEPDTEQYLDVEVVTKLVTERGQGRDYQREFYKFDNTELFTFSVPAPEGYDPSKVVRLDPYQHVVNVQWGARGVMVYVSFGIFAGDTQRRWSRNGSSWNGTDTIAWQVQGGTGDFNEEASIQTSITYDTNREVFWAVGGRRVPNSENWPFEGDLIQRAYMERSDDDGVTWSEDYGSGLPNSPAAPNGNVRLIGVIWWIKYDEPSDSLFMLMSSTDPNQEGDLMYFRSTDGGGSWSLILTEDFLDNPFNWPAESICSQITDFDQCTFSDGSSARVRSSRHSVNTFQLCGNILISTNSGPFIQNNPPAGLPVAFKAAGNAVTVITTEEDSFVRHVYVTFDGISWEEVSFPGSFYAMAIGFANSRWAVIGSANVEEGGQAQIFVSQNAVQYELATSFGDDDFLNYTFTMASKRRAQQ